MDVRPFDPARDGRALFALWDDALGPMHGGAHFVIAGRAGLLGFAATQVTPGMGETPPEGALPAVRRRGIGTALHERALANLRAAGAGRVQLGGGSPRFWPGAPTNLPVAPPFFTVRGWDFTAVSYDLIRDPRAPHAPGPGWGRPPAGVTLAVAIPCAGRLLHPHFGPGTHASKVLEN